MDRSPVVRPYHTAYYWDGVGFIKAAMGPEATLYPDLLNFGGCFSVQFRMVLRHCGLFHAG